MSVLTGKPQHGKRSHVIANFARNPLIIYWEMTQACGLACRHCRASAVCSPHKDQLLYDESSALLRQITGFGDPLPHLILTGGDPLERHDLFDIMDEARERGISISITPSVTEKLTHSMMQRLKGHGMQALGLSLDGSNAKRHEGVRGVEGCFDRSMQALDDAASLNIPVQVNTLVSMETVDNLPAIYKLLKTKKVMRWSLFFLISVGRGKALQELPPEQAEATMDWIYDISKTAPFAVKTTEAPSYRRIALQRMREEGKSMEEIRHTPLAHGFGIRDGNGIMFISHTGDICPAGFLPLAAGNVRKDNLVEVYRNSDLFRALHAPELFHGKCGVCENHGICGGSRARAYAHTGDPLASDPVCGYIPAGWPQATERESERGFLLRVLQTTH